MPMTWNAETDAKLFAAVMQVTELKLSTDNLKKIAEIMGEDCTPKALTHRIGKIRTLAKNGSSAGDDASGGEKKAAPAKAKGKGKATKKADTPVDTGDDDEEGEIEVKPKKAMAAKRKKAAKEEVKGEGDEGEGEVEKVVESVEKKIKLDEADVF